MLLDVYEEKIYSQNGEDGIIGEVFRRLAVERGNFLEIGAHASENNTQALRERGWRGLQFDTEPDGGRILKQHVTAENINTLFPRRQRLDFLSIDVDGVDWYLWGAFNRRPALVCIEYNAAWPWPVYRKVPYDSDFRWSGKDDYFGASLAALVSLAAGKHYQLLYCERQGVNAFFILDDHAHMFDPIPPPAELWRPPGYAPYPRSERWVR